MAERKTPILLRRGPVSGEIFALTNYAYVARPGLEPFIKIRTGGKQSVQHDYDALTLEHFLEESPNLAEILDGIIKGYYTDDNPMPDHEVIQVRAFRKRLVDMIERHNAHVGATLGDTSES